MEMLFELDPSGHTELYVEDDKGNVIAKFDLRPEEYLSEFYAILDETKEDPTIDLNNWEAWADRMSEVVQQMQLEIRSFRNAA